ncbi:hypothetical protein BMW24_015535 [Mycobacterium heckeshornense]|uniref:Uncharacterized protein n=1 Tax=Mycobacterium heckeshornense TaxID=110505 RepID=A0A2G8B758_9MYCO|nr:hypothetical protein [Mycobacterium heckeshornense]KMV21039.1 hypothetical protein ACT16_18610 [Mycobacterium heckeshornense]MCV7035998.1 hypothetical protein [Mycobacterium heckeshornense]PIJ33613.1 hypothetical protein BMW24_015535 [Mycobacterium heckeshornense]BCO36707.1 hypothetical protein MHEC_31400 [Mycobacterium heckeshornense]BCQ09600.1 hypothetical protein JMUB5695_03045 [Mycobacterium heckeshornense]
MVNIDDDMQLLTEQIDALKRLGTKHELAEGESYDFSIRWGTALAGRLRRLVHYSTRGLLSDADERRFRSLCDDLRALSDLIDRFELAHPVFTERPPVKAKRHGAGRFASSRRGILRRGRENRSPAT